MEYMLCVEGDIKGLQRALHLHPHVPPHVETPFFPSFPPASTLDIMDPEDAMGDDMMEEEEQLPVPQEENQTADAATIEETLTVDRNTDVVYPSEFFLRQKMNVGFVPPPFLADPKIAEQIRPPPVVQTLESRLAELDEKETTALAELRTFAAGKGYNRAEVDDWMLLRYLVARNWNVKKSSAMLDKTMEWRVKVNSQTASCPRCPRDPDGHMMCFVGWDLQHRPVMYMSHRWAMERSNVEEQVTHSIETYNHMIRLMPEGVGKWVACVDFVTYSHWRDGNSKSGKEVVTMLQDHFPERLGLQVLVDPPTAFWLLWKVLSLLIDEKTKAKVSFQYTSQDPNIATEFPKIFPPHLSDYLVKQYNANKVKPEKKK